MEELEQRLAEVKEKKNIAIRAMEYENTARLREEEKTLLKLIEEKQPNKIHQPKPIFIIRLPNESFPIDREGIEATAKNLSDKLPEYHVLVIQDRVFSVGDIKFEMYNSKDCSEIEFEKLKNKVLETIK